MKAEDLTNRSPYKVIVICDYCNKEIERKYYDYKLHHNDESGDACSDCCKLKRQKTNIKKYGCEWYTQSNEFKDKRKESMIEKYGTIHALQSEEIMEKFKDTCFKNNGVDFPMQSPLIQNKQKNTCFQNNDVDFPMQSIEIRKKSEITCMSKYGYKNTALVPEIRKKQRESLYQNDTIPTSKPERETVKLLKEIYGEDNCFPQFPTKYYNLDCLLKLDNLMIDIEYDGQWCHDDKFDKKRDRYHMNLGYKIFRIKGNHKVPTKEQLIKGINVLIKDNQNYNEIILKDI